MNKQIIFKTVLIDISYIKTDNWMIYTSAIYVIEDTFLQKPFYCKSRIQNLKKYQHKDVQKCLKNLTLTAVYMKHLYSQSNLVQKPHLQLKCCYILSHLYDLQSDKLLNHALQLETCCYMHCQKNILITITSGNLKHHVDFYMCNSYKAQYF